MRYVNERFKKGDRVYFGRPSGEKTLGKIIRVNAATYTVETLEERGVSRVRGEGAKWRVSKSLVSPADGILPPPVSAPVSVPKRDKASLLRELANIESLLEPERLYWDGERPRSEARKAERKLLRERATLISELGYEPHYTEIWGAA